MDNRRYCQSTSRSWAPSSCAGQDGREGEPPVDGPNNAVRRAIASSAAVPSTTAATLRSVSETGETPWRVVVIDIDVGELESGGVVALVLALEEVVGAPSVDAPSLHDAPSSPTITNGKLHQYRRSVVERRSQITIRSLVGTPIHALSPCQTAKREPCRPDDRTVTESGRVDAEGCMARHLTG